MKRLFDENSKYTVEAALLDNRVSQQLAKIIEEYDKQGYCPREIVTLIIRAAFDAELAYMLDRQ